MPADAPLSGFRAKYVGFNDRGALTNRTKQMTAPAVDATITVGAESTNARAITIQLLDAWGRALNYREHIDITMLLDSSGADFRTVGGSTGLAQGADGKLLAIVAKKRFVGITDPTGKITAVYTDTGTEVGYIGIRLPTGRVIVSDPVTNA